VDVREGELEYVSKVNHIETQNVPRGRKRRKTWINN